MSFESEAKRLTRDIQKLYKTVNKDAYQFCLESAVEIERTAKTLMRDSPVDTSKTYAKGHHPSQPGEAPAPDTGTLMRSITHSVEATRDGAFANVGTDLDYGKYLEYGTSKMRARPWLSQALTRCQTFMAYKFREIFGK